MISACDIFLKCIHSTDLSSAELAKALNCFDIDANRVITASEELPEHYDLTLEGMRRIIELYLAEFIGLFRDTDKVQIYATHPAPLYAMMLAGNAGKANVRIKTPEFVAMLVLRSFFGWKGAIKGVWSPASPQCGMNQMRLFLIESGCIARPAVLWNWSLLCDENCITGEILKQRYPKLQKINIARSEGRHTEAERFQALCNQVEKALLKIRQELNIDISENVEKQAWSLWMSLVLTMNSITQLNNKLQGQLLGGNDLTLVHSILLTAFSDWMPVMEALKLLHIELKDKKKRIEHSHNEYVRKKCLYCYYVPLTTPEVNGLFVRYGINLIGNTAFLSRRVEKYSQKSLSEKIALMCMQILIGNDCVTEAEEVCKQLEEYRCRGYLTGMYAYDRWLGGQQSAIAELVEKKSGYPVFFLDMDFWNANDLEILEDRIREISEMIV